MFMNSRRSNLSKGLKRTSKDEPFHAGTGVPPGFPVVVFGEGMGSYWRLRSQYWVYEPLQKSGHRPWMPHESLGNFCPSDSRPV